MCHLVQAGDVVLAAEDERALVIRDDEGALVAGEVVLAAEDETPLVWVAVGATCCSGR